MSTPVVEMWVEYVRMKDLLIHKTKYAHKKAYLKYWLLYLL